MMPFTAASLPAPPCQSPASERPSRTGTLLRRCNTAAHSRFSGTLCLRDLYGARAGDLFRRRLMTLALLKSLQHDEESRNKHDREAGRRDHAGENADPEGTARVGTGAGRKHEGQDAEDEGEGSHENRPGT